jgi:N-acetyl-anhydromuramoyl-L-alanine amidase
MENHAEKIQKPSNGLRRSGPSKRGTRLTVDEEGLLPFARYVESPNCDDRPEDASITLAVIHGISLPPGEFGGQGIIDLFTNRLDPNTHPYYASIESLRVSAHFLIRRDGELLQFVPCEKRAWHAGVSSWKGRECCNDFSIGIELEGADTIPYKPAQYHVLARVLKALYRRYRFRYVVGHSDIAPGRKTDPGPAFDWKRLERLIAKKKRR